MSEYEIYSDMSIDIDPVKAALYDVKYIPMQVIVGNETMTVSAPPSLSEMHDYYDKLRDKLPTGTSQVTPYDFEEAFTPVIKAGKGILYIALSSGLSNTYQSALIAADSLRDRYGEDNVHIEVVDSLGATSGQGMVAEAAGVNRTDGLSLRDNADWLRRHVLNVHYWFQVEDLMYLMRGGRVSGTAAVLGTALNIKPVLTILADGKLLTVAKKRGSRMAMKYLAELFEKYRDADVPDDDESAGDSRREHLKALGRRVYILSTDNPEGTGELKKLVLAADPEADISITSVSPVIGAHTGPDMLAVVFWGIARQADI